jgi:hypothetical protein
MIWAKAGHEPGAPTFHLEQDVPFAFQKRLGPSPGDYSLVVQLDPGNAFSEPMLPAAVVGAAAFTVT